MSRIRTIVKAGTEAALARLPRQSRVGDRLILAYHNIVPSGCAPIGDKSLHLPLDQFKRQLDAIVREADVVSLMDLLSRDAPNERRAAVTFDDAYASSLKLGVAECSSRNVPCAIFVAPSLLGLVPEWDVRAELGKWSTADREIFLHKHHGLTASSAEGSHLTAYPPELRIADINELSRAATLNGVSLGNHTMRHPNLAALPLELAKVELLETQAWLDERFPRQSIPVAAYPYGLIPFDREHLLSTCGVTYGLAVSGGWIARGDQIDRSLVPRWNVPASISDDGFRLRMRGWYVR